MTYYERYAALATRINLDPCSQRAADLFGLTKATISSWGIKGTTPKGETVALMADKLGVSADYLLGRTDDPTDYAKGGVTQIPETPPAQQTGPAVSDREKIVSFGTRISTGDSRTLLKLLAKLDHDDRIRAEGVIQGMLLQDKYIDSPASMPDAAHVRTDIDVIPDMIAHDDTIMDDDDF